MAASATTDHFDRFENADAARDYVDEREQQQREQRREAVEVYGKAAELFEQRVLDTVEISRHDVEIEFYRPVRATDADLSSIAENRPELAERLKRGSEYIDRFECAQRKALETLASTGDEGMTPADLEALHEDALEGTEVLRKALSAFAVDESFRDPQIWLTIFQSEDTVQELFEDFFSEGDPTKRDGRRDMLQSMLSESGSTN